MDNFYMINFKSMGEEEKGYLVALEKSEEIPFEIKRVYYTYGVPVNAKRGFHAHKKLEQLIIAASGSFTVTLDDGKCKRKFFLNRPNQCLLVRPGMWRDLDDFSSGAVCLVLASDLYRADDYISNYDEFIEFRFNNDREK